MIVTPLAPLALPPDSGTHVPGTLHVSRIIGDIMRRLDPKRYDKHTADGKPVPMDMQKVQAGVSFEQGLERILMTQTLPGLFRPDPLQVDGIWMSPDGLVPGPAFLQEYGDLLDLRPLAAAAIMQTWVVAEYKLTWYSETKDCPGDPVFTPWLWQMQAYCKGTGSRFGLLVPQFINGNYKPPKPSPPVPRLLEWTPQEIDETWTMLVNHAKAQGWL